MTTKIQDRLKIDDIFLSESTIKTDRELLLNLAIDEIGAQFKPVRAVAGKSLTSHYPDGSQIEFVHYFIEAGMRFVKIPKDEPEDEEAEGNIKEPQVVGTIDATFVAKYRIETGEPLFDEKELSKFADTARFHTYPYARELLQALSMRLRLPVFTLPILHWTSVNPNE